MGVQIPRGEGAIFGGLFALLKALGVFVVVYTKTAEPIEMLFGLLNHVGPTKHYYMCSRSDTTTRRREG